MCGRLICGLPRIAGQGAAPPRKGATDRSGRRALTPAAHVGWPRLRHGLVASLVCAAAVLAAARSARALDKQGSAHGGGLEGPTAGFDVSGSASLGVSLYNPTYAARPDNTGLTLFRYAGHVDVDLIGRRLSIPIDVNMFTDRLAHGFARKFVPSELDVIAGVTT